MPLARLGLVLVLASLSIGLRSSPEEALLAVASNFAETAQALCLEFTAATGLRVVPVFGSTGKHYAQIRNGAPFHAFLAADRERPELLESEGRGIGGTRFTYALGKIVLWCPGKSCAAEKQLMGGDFGRLAIANPRVAPYGKAAGQALRALGVWERFRERLVYGENIAQAFHFVRTGNATLGIVAQSQLKPEERRNPDQFWTIPANLYDPIEQQALLLKESAAARRFLDYLKSSEARRIIVNHGYSTP